MCRIGSSAVIVPNQYVKNDKSKSVIENKKIEEPICPTREKKNDSVNVKSKESKSNVVHSVEIEDNLKADIGEKISKAVSATIGNSQDIISTAKGIVTTAEAGTGVGVVAKITRSLAPTAKVITSFRAVQGIDKLMNTPIANKALGVFSAVGGGFEVYRGVKELKKGNKEQGVYNLVNGGSGIVMGGALLVGVAPVALAASVVGLASEVVKYGSGSVKKLGWLKGKNGESQTAFDRLGERVNDAQKIVENKTGSKALGYVAKVGAGITMVPAAVAVSVGGAVVQGTKTVGSSVSSGWNYLMSKF